MSLACALSSAVFASAFALSAVALPDWAFCSASALWLAFFCALSLAVRALSRSFLAVSAVFALESASFFALSAASPALPAACCAASTA